MTARALPESCSRLVPLYRGTLLAVDDWRCAGHDTPAGHEETSDAHCLVVTRRGAWELRVAGQPRLADPGVAVTWPRGRPTQVRHPLGGGDHCTLFRLTPAGAEALAMTGAGRRHEADGPLPPLLPLDGPAYLRHRRALAAARAGADPLLVEETALGFLRHAVPGAAPFATHSAAARRHVDAAREVIARDFRGRLTVAGIARAAGCSPFHLGRLFREATGLSLHRAVTRLRLREALERVLDEPAALSRIALDAGFASHSHLTDAFRAEYGVAPRHLRGRGLPV